MRLLMLDVESERRRPWISDLERGGFGLDFFGFLAEGSEAISITDYAAFLINNRLPDGDAIHWLRDCRSSGVDTPALVMAPASDVEERIRALESGADDCVTDAIDGRELVAKIRAILRRAPSLDATMYSAGNIRLDAISREVQVGGEPLVIPRRELGLLELLIRSFNRAVRREALDAQLYGSSGEVCPNSLEVRVSRLRRCLAQAGATTEIKTIRGVGYKLQMIERQTGAEAPRQKFERLRR